MYVINSNAIEAQIRITAVNRSISLMGRVLEWETWFPQNRLLGAIPNIFPRLFTILFTFLKCVIIRPFFVDKLLEESFVFFSPTLFGDGKMEGSLRKCLGLLSGRLQKNKLQRVDMRAAYRFMFHPYVHLTIWILVLFQRKVNPISCRHTMTCDLGATLDFIWGVWICFSNFSFHISRILIL